MSWKLKIALALSFLWMSSWFYVYYVVFAQDPAALVIFIFCNPVLLGVVWGLYFCFKKKKPPNSDQQNLLNNIANVSVKGSYKNPMVFSNCYTLGWVFFLVTAFVFGLIKPPNKYINEIVFIILYALVDIVIYFLWIYRASKNAHILGAARMNYSPKEAALWVTIPVMTWIGNYYVIKELWKASKNPVASLWQSEKDPIIVKLRWLFLMFVIIMNVLHKQNPVNYINIVFALVSIVYIILSIIIVDKVSRMQRLNYETIMPNR